MLPKRAPKVKENYWTESSRPLYALLFLLPLITLYEVGIAYFNSATSQLQVRNAADVLLRQAASGLGMMALFEKAGLDQGFIWFMLSGLIVVLTLVVWQFAVKSSWTVKPGYIGLMWFESCFFGLLMVGVLMGIHVLSRPELSNPDNIRSMPTGAGLTLSVGAGIFEEYLFRLAGMGLVFLFLRRVVEVSAAAAYITSAVLTAVVFAAFHLAGPFGESFDAARFLLRTCSGLFFASLFAVRGFGVTAGAHAAYDAIVVLIGGAA
jgi:hypothetical protein